MTLMVGCGFFMIALLLIFVLLPVAIDIEKDRF